MADPNRFFERLPALQHRDYRNLWMGQVISAAGSQMQSAALHWQVYELTKDPIALGAVGLVRIIPIILFSLIGGAAADSFDRRRVLLITQSILATVAVILGILSLTGYTTLPLLYILTAIGASAIAFDNPARQSLIPALVPREHLPNAFAINSTGFQVATIVGPVLAGLIIGKVGLGWAYIVNFCTFMAVITALLTMRYRMEPEQAALRAGGISLNSLKEGIAFVRSTPILVATMTLDFWATFFSSAAALLPIFASDILKVGPEGFGWLSACPALGSLIAGASMTFLPPIKEQGKVIVWSVILYGLATIGFGLSQNLYLSGLFLALTGTTDTVSTIIRQTIRQSVTPDHMRGRMVSVGMLFFMGGPQLGEMEAGLVARWTNPMVSVVSGGVACVLIAAGCIAKWPWFRNYRLEESVKEVKTG